jgi:hypothetical protein
VLPNHRLFFLLHFVEMIVWVGGVGCFGVVVVGTAKEDADIVHHVTREEKEKKNVPEKQDSQPVRCNTPSGGVDLFAPRPGLHQVLPPNDLASFVADGFGLVHVDHVDRGLGSGFASVHLRERERILKKMV